MINQSQSLSLLALLCLLMTCTVVQAEQSERFGDYVVHYSAFTSDQLTPEVAQAYGIRRSSNRALVNITILQSKEGSLPEAVAARVEATASNLLGQKREIEIQEIREQQEAIYYIGETMVRHMETLRFSIEITPEGERRPFELKFSQQFYTE